MNGDISAVEINIITVHQGIALDSVAGGRDGIKEIGDRDIDKLFADRGDFAGEGNLNRLAGIQRFRSYLEIQIKAVCRYRGYCNLCFIAAVFDNQRRRALVNIAGLTALEFGINAESGAFGIPELREARVGINILYLIVKHRPHHKLEHMRIVNHHAVEHSLDKPGVVGEVGG